MAATERAEVGQGAERGGSGKEARLIGENEPEVERDLRDLRLWMASAAEDLTSGGAV